MEAGMWHDKTGLTSEDRVKSQFVESENIFFMISRPEEDADSLYTEGGGQARCGRGTHPSK